MYTCLCGAWVCVRRGSVGHQIIGHHQSLSHSPVTSPLGLVWGSSLCEKAAVIVICSLSQQHSDTIFKKEKSVSSSSLSPPSPGPTGVYKRAVWGSQTCHMVVAFSLFFLCFQAKIQSIYDKSMKWYVIIGRFRSYLKYGNYLFCLEGRF